MKQLLQRLDSGEAELIADAVASNWIAPLGPHVDAFEEEFAARIGVKAAAATSSGTAALHLALILAGVKAGDEVLVSTLTFAASVNPILYLGATPVFIDSETESWNLDPALVAEAVESRARAGRPPAAVIVVHLYGQSANLDPILKVCGKHGVPVIEDAAEALGATYKGRPVGSFGLMSIFPFNGNKIITTSGGGMLVSDDPVLADRARKLASQAREPALHYEHKEVGYNYRLSNILAALGRGQLELLNEKVAARRRVFDRYVEGLGDLPGVTFMPEASWGSATRWLTALTLVEDEVGIGPRKLCESLGDQNIEARPLWKPMHLQPVFSGFPGHSSGVSDRLFQSGICSPSGSDLSECQLGRVIDHIRPLVGR
jgi:pyridoxal phosphate-dependent aminotransferase EpsN